MNSLLKPLATRLIIVSSIGMIIIGILFIVLRAIGMLPNDLLLLLAGTMLGVIVALGREIIGDTLPRAFNIALLGFPQSGKTTLIVSLFGELLTYRVFGIDAQLRGTKTIERVNEFLALLKQGKALPPTKDQDKFAYTANIYSAILRIGKTWWSFGRRYKVEIGDFPGENTKDYVTKYGKWLHTTDFFKWTMEAEAIVFVIDLGKYVNPADQRKYIADMTSAIRAAWQHIVEYDDARREDPKKRTIILVFTKVDVFGLAPNGKTPEQFEKALVKLAFGKTFPPLREIDQEVMVKGRVKVLDDFDELIDYLSNETRKFDVIFTSCSATENGLRVGLFELVSRLLPK